MVEHKLDTFIMSYNCFLCFESITPDYLGHRPNCQTVAQQSSQIEHRNLIGIANEFIP